MNEAYFLLMLNNHNIPRAYGLYDVRVLGAPGLGMLLDFKSGSDFSNWIPVGGFPEWVIKGMMVQVVEALVYLHGILIVHRDIKPSNLFCERGNDGSVKVCVGDFGLAAHAEEKEALSKRCGSPGFVAPEIFDEKYPEMIRSSPQAPNEQVLKIDVFSFGMTLYGAVLGVNPFIAPTLNRTYKNNARAEIPADDIARVSAELRDLLKWLTARNPRRRCSIGNAARHPWLQADLRALGFTGANEDMHGDNISWELFEEQSSRLRDLP
jgi:serine/threonine protein kinase